MQPAPVEWYAASVQAIMIAALAALCGVLYSRYQKRYFLWWTIAWFFYSVRISAIFMFAFTEHSIWLYVVQVAAGYSAVALLWAAIVFSRQPPSRWWYIPFVVLPPLWPYLAMYRFDSILLASTAPALLQTIALYWSCILFAQFSLAVRSRAALLLAITFGAWALYNMRFSVLSTTGAWDAVALYGNLLFLGGVGLGILLLITEDLHRGLQALSVLSGDLQPGSARHDDIDALLDRPLALAGVRGSALFLGTAQEGRFVRGRGTASSWQNSPPAAAARAAIASSLESGRPHSGPGWSIDPDPAAGVRSQAKDLKLHRYAAVLPLAHEGQMIGALVIVGDTRDPFTALGESFLIALGQQVGAALENADLYRRVEARTRELQHLSRQMVRQHEDERRRLALELHDETAQLLSTVKMALGMERRHADPGQASRLDHVLTLVDRGIRSIRGVVNQLRPPLLDDLGLVTALRAVVADFSERGSITATLDAPDELRLDPEAEFAVFRVVQEALSNVARHANATEVSVKLSRTATGAQLIVEDNGVGFRVGGGGNGDSEPTPRVLVLERTGITGMRARLAAVGGDLELSAREDGGARLTAYVTAAPTSEPAIAAIASAR
jgi:signal transduction histidine kinase